MRKPVIDEVEVTMTRVQWLKVWEVLDATSAGFAHVDVDTDGALSLFHISRNSAELKAAHQLASKLSKIGFDPGKAIS